MTTPDDRFYTKDHEWIRLEGDAGATIGITEFAQGELGDLVFVDVPKVGAALEKGKSFCVIESTKAASDVYAPISGTVTEGNQLLSSQPELVNQSPYDRGWLCKVSGVADCDTDGLFDAEQYAEYLRGKKQ